MHPSVGRIVHYYPNGFPGPWAAVVTYVFPVPADDPDAVPDVSLTAYPPPLPNGTRAPVVMIDRAALGQQMGCWDWPPRV